MEWRVTGGRSRVAAAGSRQWQEWGDAAGPGLGEEGVLAVRSKGGRSVVPFAAYYSAREEGTMVQACSHVRRRKPVALVHVSIT